MHIYHIFIHSFVDGQLGCFHVLAAINSAAVIAVLSVLFCFVFCLFLATAAACRQGLNLHHSNNWSHSSDNVGSLTH